MKQFNGHNELQRLSHEYGKEEVLRGFMAAILVEHFEGWWDENKHMSADDCEAEIYNLVEGLPYEWADKAADDAWAEAKLTMTDYPERDTYLSRCLARYV